MVSDFLGLFKKAFGFGGNGGADIQNAQFEGALGHEFADEYEDSGGFNIVAIVANKLSNIVCGDSSISIAGGGFVAESLERCVRRLNLIVTRVFGVGGVVLKPYLQNGRVYTDILAQERYFVLEKRGEAVVKAGFVADVKHSGRARLLRLEIHTLSVSGELKIENRAFKDDREISLKESGFWMDYEPEISISGVEQMLYAHLKCPVDSRKTGVSGFGGADEYGVPITYGQSRLVGMISDILREIPDEYRNKKAFIGAEDLLFDSGNKLPQSGLYKLLRSNGGTDRKSFWEVFSPEIRHTSYFAGLDYLLALLEKAIGVNRGVLTDLDTKDATATAIKRSTFDTFNVVNAMRRGIEDAVREIVYAYEVIGRAFGLDEAGIDSDISFDWSYSLLEDSAETWGELLEGKREGAVSVAELRMYLFDEDAETAKKHMPSEAESV